MTAVSTHVLDTARGVPAAGVEVELFAAGGSLLGSGITDADGRIGGLAGPDGAPPGTCRLVFASGGYQRRLGGEAFLEEVAVSFNVGDQARLHIPLLLSPFGLSIYRGS